jgi:hypothetical protein
MLPNIDKVQPTGNWKLGDSTPWAPTGKKQTLFIHAPQYYKLVVLVNKIPIPPPAGEVWSIPYPLVISAVIASIPSF